MAKSFGHSVRTSTFTVGDVTRVSYWLEWHQPPGRFQYRPYKVSRKATREAAIRFARKHNCSIHRKEEVTMDPIFDYEGFVPAQVQQALESAYKSKRRIRLWYGFTEKHLATGCERSSVGRSWGDDFDVTGTVGRSTGRTKIPLLIKSARSRGGSGIISTSIVRIDDIASRTHLFKHPAFRSGFEGSVPVETNDPAGTGFPSVDQLYAEGYRYEVANDRGQVISRHKTFASAQNYIDFQNGSRYSK